MRTTLDIDRPILDELKALQNKEKKSLGRLVSDLLAVALADRKQRRPPAAAQRTWVVRSMRAKVDLSDKDALNAATDRSDGCQSKCDAINPLEPTGD